LNSPGLTNDSGEQAWTKFQRKILYDENLAYSKAKKCGEWNSRIDRSETV